MSLYKVQPVYEILPISQRPNVKESEKLILDPHPYRDQYQNLIISRRSSPVHAYTMFGRYPLTGS